MPRLKRQPPDRRPTHRPLAGAAAAARGGGVPCHMPDKREGLTPGKYDAGQVAMNLKLVSSMRQPEGMYDPNATGRSLDYANSDLAFGLNGRLALQGNFHGLIFYDVEDPAKVKLQTIVACPGGQGDVSIWGHLAFMSVEGYGRSGLRTGDAGVDAAARHASGRRRRRPPQQAQRISRHRPPAGRGAGGGRGAAPADPDRMYGVRIFDITDPLKPRQVAGVQTCRGSHTHSIVTDPNDKDNIYIYVSGTSGDSLARGEGGLRRRSERARTRRASAST